MFVCPHFCFTDKSNCIDDEHSIHQGEIQTSVNKLSHVMKSVLESMPNGVLSKNICQGLLLPSSDEKSTTEKLLTEPDHGEGQIKEDEDETINLWKGIPKRPYYIELSKRLVIQARWNFTKSMSATNQSLLGALTSRISKPEVPPLLVPATELGLNEISPSFVPNQTLEEISEKACLEWLRCAGDRGVLAVLGMRRTVGTSLLKFPPEVWQLKKAAREPHYGKGKQTKKIHNKNGTQQPLTTAARARSKHAHRAQADASFFGVANGKVEKQNLETDMILEKMMNEAVWLNFHMIFSKKIEENVPIFEIRIKEGYGARWRVKSVECDTKNSKDVDNKYFYDLQFRGFLEPTMENGHEKRWRH